MCIYNISACRHDLESAPLGQSSRRLDQSVKPAALIDSRCMLGAHNHGFDAIEHKTLKWALMFEDTGKMHRYTREQIRAKFGAEQAN